jgi:hypothetical protein
MHEESPNGGTKWWLASGEWAVVACLHIEEKWQNGRKLPMADHFIGGGERERERGWSWSRTSATADRRLGGAAGPRHTSGPLTQVADWWASVSVLKGGAGPNLHPGRTVHNPT